MILCRSETLHAAALYSQDCWRWWLWRDCWPHVLCPKATLFALSLSLDWWDSSLLWQLFIQGPELGHPSLFCLCQPRVPYTLTHTALFSISVIESGSSIQKVFWPFKSGSFPCLKWFEVSSAWSRISKFNFPFLKKSYGDGGGGGDGDREGWRSMYAPCSSCPPAPCECICQRLWAPAAGFPRMPSDGDFHILWCHIRSSKEHRLMVFILSLCLFWWWWRAVISGCRLLMMLFNSVKVLHCKVKFSADFDG